MHEPYISHQIAEVTFLAAYIPLGYKLLDLQWSSQAQPTIDRGRPVNMDQMKSCPILGHPATGKKVYM